MEGAAEGPQLTLNEAYLVQAELTALNLSSGRRIAGYKLGYTSLAMRRQMGIDAPNFGPLYADMIVDSGATVRGYTQPRVEPEIAVILGADIAGSRLMLPEIADAVAGVHACLEIVDSVWRDYRFSLEQNTADGSSAAGVVLGPDLGVAPRECERVRVRFAMDGRLLGTATGAAAGGHPLLGVAWLCAQLEKRGEGLHAGQIVLTGGLTAAAPLGDGCFAEAIYDHGAGVSVCRAE
ncbi:2-keto-4-pentenoate hydratase [Solimonas soli]|uniref:2-keto-4-pentenoate hydratase n=1 Tax=Solimonas soli TaxID=413479 RepID=UPI0012F9D227|nr:fumarylacetoacetate hydrolase family protein [Solimonas soli]